MHEHERGRDDGAHRRPERGAGVVIDLACQRDRSGGVARRCRHCAAEKPIRWGRTKRGLQRWRCRRCRRSFCAVTGTPLERMHARDAFAVVLANMLGPRPASCRALAGRLAIGRMTVWRWRQLICRVLRRTGGSPPDDCVERAVLVVRESRKASREWVRHARDPARFAAPDRRRWIDYRLLGLPLPDPMAPFRVSIGIICDAGSRCRLRATRCGVPGASAVIGVSTTGPTASALPEAASPGRTDISCRLGRFLAPFCGPASKHLDGYLAWFAARRQGAGPALLATVRRELLRALPITSSGGDF